VVTVTLLSDDHRGRAEASGVYYFHETVETILADLEDVRHEVEHGVTRQGLQELLPAGGARNALDCAFWDLDAARAGEPVWSLAGVGAPRPLLTTCTIGIDAPEMMAQRARDYVGARAIKVKLSGDDLDAERIRAVRAAREEVCLGIDGNQGFTLASLAALLPTLEACRVQLIEQPFPRGSDELLEDYHGGIEIALDESIQTLKDIAGVSPRCQVVNLKLDKSGGLTEALLMARAARARGLKVMVGNMTGTSLGMAPGFVVGQLCDVVDLDGPLLLARDRESAADYVDGYIDCGPQVWGGG
jgi:L-alanine-DL-glutamate epimerase-like enolase superfamily enzyme